MTRLIFGWIFVLLCLLTALTGFSKLAGSTMPAPLLIGKGENAEFVIKLVSSTDMRTGVRFERWLPWDFTTFSADNCRIVSADVPGSSFHSLNLANGRYATYPVAGMTAFDRRHLMQESPDHRWLALKYGQSDLHPLIVIDTLTGDQHRIADQFEEWFLGWLDTNRFYYKLFESAQMVIYNMADHARQSGIIEQVEWFHRWRNLFLLPDGDTVRLYDAAAETTRYRISNYWTVPGDYLKPMMLSPDQQVLAFMGLDNEHRSVLNLYHFASGTRLILPQIVAAHDSELGWSPDSTKLVYQTMRADGTRSDEALVVSASNGEILYHIHAMMDRGAVWSPDSRYLFTATDTTLYGLDTYSGQITTWFNLPYILNITYPPGLIDASDSAWFALRWSESPGNVTHMKVLTMQQGQLETRTEFHAVPYDARFCIPKAAS